MASYATPEELAAAQQYGMSLDPGSSGVPMALPQEQVDPYLAAAQQAQAAGYVPSPQADVAGPPVSPEMAAAQAYASAQQPAPVAQPAYLEYEAPKPQRALVTGAPVGSRVEPEPIAEPQPQPRPAGMGAIGKARKERSDAQSNVLGAYDELANLANPGGDTVNARNERAATLDEKTRYVEERGAEMRRIGNQTQADAEKIQREIVDANKEADAIQVKDRRTDTDRMMGILSVGLAGIGDAFTAMGGQKTNHADNVYNMIMEQVNRDLDMQREAKRDARQKASDKKDELDIAMKLASNKQEAFQLQTQLVLGKYVSALDAIDSRILSAEARDEAARVSAKIKAERAQIQENYAQQKVAESVRAAAGSARKTAWDSLTREQLQALKDQGRLPAEGEFVLQKLSGDKPKASAETDKSRRILEGVAPSADDVRDMVASGYTPRSARSRAYTPEVFSDTGDLQREASIAAMRDILLRDESGAAIGEAEAEKKIAGWGLDSSDPAVRRQGMQKMLAEYESRLAAVGGEMPSERPKPTRVVKE